MLALVLMLFFPMAVIDFCLTRTLVCDEDTNYQSLRLSWASKTSCDQRKGKAPEAELTEAPVVIHVFLESFAFVFSLIGHLLCWDWSLLLLLLGFLLSVSGSAPKEQVATYYLNTLHFQCEILRKIYLVDMEAK